MALPNDAAWIQHADLKAKGIVFLDPHTVLNTGSEVCNLLVQRNITAAVGTTTLILQTDRTPNGVPFHPCVASKTFRNNKPEWKGWSMDGPTSWTGNTEQLSQQDTMASNLTWDNPADQICVSFNPYTRVMRVTLALSTEIYTRTSARRLIGIEPDRVQMGIRLYPGQQVRIVNLRSPAASVAPQVIRRAAAPPSPPTVSEAGGSESEATASTRSNSPTEWPALSAASPAPSPNKAQVKKHAQPVTNAAAVPKNVKAGNVVVDVTDSPAEWPTLPAASPAPSPSKAQMKKYVAPGNEGKQPKETPKSFSSSVRACPPTTPDTVQPASVAVQTQAAVGVGRQSWGTPPPAARAAWRPEAALSVPVAMAERLETVSPKNKKVDLVVGTTNAREPCVLHLAGVCNSSECPFSHDENWRHQCKQVPDVTKANQEGFAYKRFEMFSAWETPKGVCIVETKKRPGEMKHRSWGPYKPDGRTLKGVTDSPLCGYTVTLQKSKTYCWNKE